LTPSQIRRVHSILAKHQVRHLLMGGQACVLYGGAEFSRDLDIVVLADAANLSNLQAALTELQAERIEVPHFHADYLQKGHAVHFRCHDPEAERIRIDVMSKLRGVDEFPSLWERRTTLVIDEGLAFEVLGLPDLIRAKKTQRDKDWPMIRQLIEAHHAEHRARATPEQVRFWFQEARTPSLLIELATPYPEIWLEAARTRPLLTLAKPNQEAALDAGLREEEFKEREADRQYWLPLRQELERLRHIRSK
jgi:hypothetical protein